MPTTDESPEISVQRSEFDERGFVVVRDIFPPELMDRAAIEAEALPERLKHYRELHAWPKLKYAEFGKMDTYFR